MAELAYTRRLSASARAAFGTVAGRLIGAPARVGWALLMIALFRTPTTTGAGWLDSSATAWGRQAFNRRRAIDRLR